MSAISSVFGALKYVPATVARKALEKVNPGFKNYFSSALSYGIDANRALDYISDRFESSAQRDYKEKLEQGARAETLRPDEKASRSQIKNAEMPGKLLRGAAAIGGAALAGGLPSGIAQAAQSVSNEQPEHVPGLGQYKGEHEPNIGQMKGENIPGLGQMQSEHGPNPLSERQLALMKYNQMNKRKKELDKMNTDFESEYGQKMPPNLAQELQMRQQAQQPKQGGQNIERLIQLLQQRKQQGR